MVVTVSVPYLQGKSSCSSKALLHLSIARGRATSFYMGSQTWCEYHGNYPPDPSTPEVRGARWSLAQGRKRFHVRSLSGC